MLAERGEIEQAATLAHESIAIFDARGNLYEQAGGFGTLGLLALLQGNLWTGTPTAFPSNGVCDSEQFAVDGLPLATAPGFGYPVSRGSGWPRARLLIESWNCCIDLNRKHLLPRVCVYLAETALCEAALEEAEHWLALGISYRAGLGLDSIVQVNYFFVAARLAVARQDYSRAASLFGLAEVTRVRARCTLSESVRAQVDATLATTQAALEPKLFAEAFTAGQQMPLFEAFTTLLRTEFIVLNPSRGTGFA